MVQRKLLKSSQEMDALVAENQQLIAEKASLEDENIRLHVLCFRDMRRKSATAWPVGWVCQGTGRSLEPPTRAFHRPQRMPVFVSVHVRACRNTRLYTCLCTHVPRQQLEKASLDKTTEAARTEI